MRLAPLMVVLRVVVVVPILPMRAIVLRIALLVPDLRLTDGHIVAVMIGIPVIRTVIRIPVELDGDLRQSRACAHSEKRD